MAGRISHYSLLDRLGTGGMGTVWRARDTRTRAVVALKVLHQHLASDPEYVKRFEREARIAASIDSPHVVRVLDSGSDGDSRFLVMDYVVGKTLAQHIHEQGRLSIDETVSISTGIAAALEAAHALGIIHRDISPQNVLLQADGTVKVTDFGVARDLGATAMTATSMLLGKPQYVAPEIVTGSAPADIRADIYSLGIVIYQMLTGSAPFNAATPYAILRMHETREPPPIERTRSDVPDWLLAVLSQCLAKDPRDRFQNPGDLLRVLRQDSTTQAPLLKRRVRLLVGTGVLGLIVFSVVLGMALIDRDGADAGPEKSESIVAPAPSLAVPTMTLQPSPTEAPVIEPTPEPAPNEIRVPPSSTSPVAVAPNPTATATPFRGWATVWSVQWLPASDFVGGSQGSSGTCNFSSGPLTLIAAGKYYCLSMVVSAGGGGEHAIQVVLLDPSGKQIDVAFATYFVSVPADGGSHQRTATLRIDTPGTYFVSITVAGKSTAGGHIKVSRN